MDLDTQPDRTLAVTLLAERRTEIAQAIVRLARRLEPRWGTVPQSVAEASATTQLRAVEKFLRTGDASELLSTVRELVKLRQHGGFGVGDFAIKSHAYLPVIRRVFLRVKHPTSDAMRAYDVVESAMLPLIALLLTELAPPVLQNFDELDEEEDTVPGARAAQVQSLNPFTMVDVDAEL